MPNNYECWQIILDFLDYAVSWDGRIMRLSKTKGSYPGRILIPKKHTSGYFQISLKKNKRYHYRYIHRLVLLTFVGKCPSGKEVNHKNSIKTDNRLTNLEYLDRKLNSQHQGVENGNAKLQEKDIFKIRKLFKKGISKAQLSRMFNISDSHVGQICFGKSWKHI